MGEDVVDRRAFIETHAKEVTNLTSEHEDNEPTAPMGQLENRSLTEEMRTSYINYAMSVIIGRALPDARDGLKPVHRRVLYGMFEGGYTHEKKYSKSARSVGEVMGNTTRTAIPPSTRPWFAWLRISPCATPWWTGRQLRQHRRRPPCRDAIHGEPSGPNCRAHARRHSEGHGDLPTTSTTASKNPPSCLRGCRTCCSTAQTASRSAWPRASRRTT